MIRAVLAASAACFIFWAAPAAAAQAGCDGSRAILRISKIKPGASLAGFMDAVKDQNAWYRSHGVRDNSQVTATVIDDPKPSNAIEVLTLHLNPPAEGTFRGEGDAAWKAYVEKYRKVSDIEIERTVCFPKSFTR